MPVEFNRERNRGVVVVPAQVCNEGATGHLVVLLRGEEVLECPLDSGGGFVCDGGGNPADVGAEGGEEAVGFHGASSIFQKTASYFPVKTPIASCSLFTRNIPRFLSGRTKKYFLLFFPACISCSSQCGIKSAMNFSGVFIERTNYHLDHSAGFF